VLKEIRDCLEAEIQGRAMINCRFRSAFLISSWLLFEICSPSAALSASPVELISNFRVSQGLGRVTMDPTLNRIAQEQATAMAARDVLDHGVAGSFSSRVASSGSTLPKISLMGTTASPKPSINGSTRVGIAKIFRCKARRGLVSRAQKVRRLAALIGH
jgi:hypothetical protein